jgi:hypothetical protein
MTRTPPAFGTQATRLHTGRILLVLTLLVGAALTAWVWVFHKGARSCTSSLRVIPITRPSGTIPLSPSV